MWDLLRDSTLGGFINHVSNGKLLPYADQKPGYQLPERYTTTSSGSNEKSDPTPKGSISLHSAPGEHQFAEATDGGRRTRDEEKAESRLSQITITPANVDPNLVDWDGPDDPDYPPSAALHFFKSLYLTQLFLNEIATGVSASESASSF